MIDGRLAQGPAAYDPASFLRSLSTEPLGDLSHAGLETLQPGVAVGPLFGGTLTQLLASFETPYAFSPPDGHVLFLDEVGERPYRIHRMLMQLRLSGRMAARVGDRVRAIAALRRARRQGHRPRRRARRA